MIVRRLVGIGHVVVVNVLQSAERKSRVDKTRKLLFETSGAEREGHGMVRSIGDRSTVWRRCDERADALAMSGCIGRGGVVRRYMKIMIWMLYQIVEASGLRSA